MSSNSSKGAIEKDDEFYVSSYGHRVVPQLEERKKKITEDRKTSLDPGSN